MKTRYLLLIPFFIMFINDGFSVSRTTIASGNWNNPAIWSPAGAPATYDIVTISHTVTINVTARCLDMNVNGSGKVSFLSGQSLVIYRNLTTAGSWAGNGVLYQYAGTVTGTAPIAAPLVLRLRTGSGVVTIANGTQFSGLSSLSCEADGGTGGSVVNNGSIVNNGTFTIDGSTTFNNAANGQLTVSKNIVSLNGGAFNASGNPNTVTYTGTGWTTVKGATYHNLDLSNGTTTSQGVKTLGGNIVANGTVTVRFNVRLNCANFNVTVNDTWIDNNANNNMMNVGTFTFGGTNPTLLRLTNPEVFGNVIVNCTGTFTLNSTNTAGYTGAFQCANLTFTSGTLDVNATGNYNVSVSGNISMNGGSLQPQTGTVFLNGTAAQTISGSTPLTFYNLSASNAAGINVSSGTITVSNVVSVPSGSFGASGGNILIPATGATTYGRIGTVSGSLTGTGWIVQSYINGPATAYWQYLSTPIDGNTIADWDNDTRFYMSGVGGNDGTACCPTFYSVRTYNEPTNTYSNVTSTATALTRGRGYMVWMADNTSQLTSPLVYNSVGLPNFSTVNYPVTAGGAGGGYNLVGNPYACPITYSSVVSSSSATLDPSFVILQENGSYATDPNGGVIAPNQGFMCVATTGGNITFTEAAKNTTALPNILKVAQAVNTLHVAVNNSVNGLGSQTTIRFTENATNSFEAGQDLLYLANVYETADNIWSVTEDDRLTLRNSLAFENGKKVPVVVKSGTAGLHTLSFKGVGSFEMYNCIILEDVENGTFTDLSRSQAYNFSADEAGIEKQFIVHFSNRSDCTPLKGRIAANVLDENTQVFNNGNGIFVKFGFEEITQATISVYNAAGQLVTEPVSGKFSSEAFQLNAPENNQIYFVVIQSGENRITRKIFY